MPSKLLLLGLFLAAGAGAAAEGPAKVVLEKTAAGGWSLQVNDAPFPIHGAGGATTPGLLEKLKEAGGNCLRTWGIEELDAKTPGQGLLDRAHRLGIMVVPGIWIGHERHGFNYADKAMVDKQRAVVIEAVRKYKNHPAVLMWGLGNEMEGPDSPTGSIPVYQEIEELAKLVKAEDPNHPVMSVIAFNPSKLESVKRYCPSLDVLGLNSYGGAGGAGTALKRAGWTKPFAITEFGVNGPWEVSVTSWGAPYEPTSQEKARSFYATNRLVTEINDGKELCLGMFPFLWGWKQERTATWFGMFLPTLEKLPPVDAMTRAWTGHWPANRCPILNSLTSLAAGKIVKPDQRISATVDAEDPEGDKLQYRWQLFAESGTISVGGDHEDAPAEFPDLIQINHEKECLFKTPNTTGNFRLYVTILDGKGNAATANFPFRVEP